MKSKPKIPTSDDVREALERFRARGGLIKRLPSEVTPAHLLVGAKYGVYEPIRGYFVPTEPSGSGDAA
ncbi:MAG: hypothetical protein HY423_14795 [Candidatus Lambdaproteobacteria bacterium]|nr:hypothetical protein [Candidatus Lambdaproteobacteria bacterium]